MKNKYNGRILDVEDSELTTSQYIVPSNVIVKNNASNKVRFGNGKVQLKDLPDVGSSSSGGSIPLGTDNQLLGYEAGVAKPVIIQIKHLSDINGFPSFSNGVFTATSINSVTKTALLSFIEFSTTAPKVGTFPTYGTAGVLPIGNATADNHAAALSQLPKVATVAPLANGTASVGTSLLYARQDHVHPLQASVATLTTGRTFSLSGGATGTSAVFTGAANATIPVTLATPTATVRGGILQQPAIADVSGRPLDESDYNALLAALRTAGLLAT